MDSKNGPKVLKVRAKFWVPHFNFQDYFTLERFLVLKHNFDFLAIKRISCPSTNGCIYPSMLRKAITSLFRSEGGRLFAYSRNWPKTQTCSSSPAAFRILSFSHRLDPIFDGDQHTGNRISDRRWRNRDNRCIDSRTRGIRPTIDREVLSIPHATMVGGLKKRLRIISCICIPYGKTCTLIHWSCRRYNVKGLEQ